MKALAVLASPLMLLLASCGVGTKASEGRPPAPVRAAAVKLFTPQSGERYSASLAPARQLTMSFRVPGFVESVYEPLKGQRLEPGDLVPAGSDLAVLRPKDYDVQVSQAKGQADSSKKTIDVARALLAEAEASSVRAEAVWKRAESLYQSRAMTAPDWEAAKASRDTALAQVASARSQVEVAQGQEVMNAAALSSADLAKSDTVLVAPWTARLLQRSAEAGAFISPGQPAFVLADMSSVKAVFGVPDFTVVSLGKGSRVPLTVEAVPGNFIGAITSIAAAADPATRLFAIEASVANPHGTLRSGMIGTVYLRSSGPAQPVAVVPLSSIIRARGEAGGFSLMVVQQNRAVSRTVTLGTTYGDLIVVNGVQPGEIVINSGASLIAEGEPVEVIQ